MKKTTILLVCLIATTIFCTAQNTRSIGRKYSQKLIDQEKQFDEKNKTTKESTTTKDIAVEIPVARNIDVCIENTNRAIEIKTWEEPKIKIIVNAIEASNNVSNEALLEKINVKTKLFGKSFKIIADVIGGNTAFKSTSNNAKNVLTIYVPKENSLCIKSKYADVAVLDAVKKVDVDITNGNLELNVVKNLSLISKYANVYINEVENAEIDFMNGDLSIATLGNGEVETKYAKIEIGTAKKIALNSTNDDYEIEEIDVLDGNKNYGNMRIGKLNESIQIDGTNADVKIKKISSEIKSIWFNDKYANLKLPLKEVKGFNLEFEGVYSTIHKNFFIYTNEESKISLSDNKNSTYKAVVGNGATKINIKCQNCTVDFK
ncbi:MAG: hypothetical protein NTZ59_04975 [Bacteroidetes bacterium]|nr:hypothetical protein [Bacteroidota bacterium]